MKKIRPRSVRKSKTPAKSLKVPDLFGRVVSILENARASIVRSVNRNMVLAYWLIGREIVREVQGGEKRASYGQRTLDALSKALVEKYGNGFSTVSLWNYRKFYEIFADREIRYPLGSESGSSSILSPMGREFSETSFASSLERKPESKAKGHTVCDLLGFDPRLTWSHYRALMRVAKPDARDFYEREAAANGWDTRSLERQIHSYYYERSHGVSKPAQGIMKPDASQQIIDSLKSPYVLEFLDLPDAAALHESQLEQAVISHLRDFLLELGKGFALVSRQKRMRFDDVDLYVDLVFYNCHLKCYLLIDLKLGKLSHRDVGQMDGYVRMFDDQIVGKGDNPTIGLILCAEKNEAVARYSVLSDRRRIFASKYMLYLPTEKELEKELRRERKLWLDRNSKTGRNASCFKEC